ncbi:inner kinetochore subunit Ame1p [Monosporozyma servazzii]
MDRQTKRLYRQRGSYLRRTTDEDNVLVIRTPFKPQSVINDNIPSTPLQDYNNNDNNNNNDNDNIIDYSINDNQNIQSNDTFTQGDIKISPHVNVSPQQIDYNKFNENKISSISKISLISINVLQKIYNHIITNILIPKAKKNISQNNNNNNSISNLMYNIDLNIFILLLNGINKDFNDIKDINIANNELYLQFKNLTKLKRQLKNKILLVKRSINKIKLSNHNKSFNNKDNNTLSSKLNLNNDLIKLNKILNKNQIISNDLLLIKSNNDKIDNNITNINKICNIYDPYNGILSKLKSINSKLSTKK